MNGDIDDGDFVALDEVEKIQSEAMDGLRESFAKQLSTIEADISSLNSKFKNNSDVSQALTLYSISSAQGIISS